ncbi:probable calcium-binding protein CML48 isoform X1 [Lolium perenne]|uniref:probable calcium-binding protein CML48 isoform X1 n=1 Tax=Lolium perenne TaxID=4522 RepID=UPI0021F52DD5|nr:calcium-binding protein CBP-like [Lolium perenne]
MADYNRYDHGHGQGYGQGYGGYPPSAPPARVPAPSSSSPYGYRYGQGGGYPPPAPVPASSSSSSPYGYGQGGGYRPPAPSSSSPYGHGYGQGGGYPPSAPVPVSSSPSPYGYGYGQGGGYPPTMGSFGGGAVAFPPGTHPDVERAFRAADRDGSGRIDERELQDALSDTYHRFSIRTVRLLMSFSQNTRASSPPQMGPADFVSLWNCLGQWRGIFDRYDRDRSGRIDSNELNQALRGLGYAVPPSVIEALIANYNDGASRRGALDFDNFVECGMIVKGLTDKFKEKDMRYTGSAALTYDSFLSIVIPFIVP